MEINTLLKVQKNVTKQISNNIGEIWAMRKCEVINLNRSYNVSYINEKVTLKYVSRKLRNEKITSYNNCPRQKYIKLD
jgi:hypothetical protein